MRSVARTAGPMAIGVILSVSGTDGTLGLRAIKDEGGITFVQEPGTAAQQNMPQSALDAGCADFSLTAAEIGDELMRLSSHPYVGRARRPRARTGARHDQGVSPVDDRGARGGQRRAAELERGAA